MKGVPEHIRSDNGPEFVARDLRQWLAATGARTLYIEPGSPWENGYCESFNSKLHQPRTPTLLPKDSSPGRRRHPRAARQQVRRNVHPLLPRLRPGGDLRHRRPAHAEGWRLAPPARRRPPLPLPGQHSGFPGASAQEGRKTTHNPASRPSQQRRSILATSARRPGASLQYLRGVSMAHFPNPSIKMFELSSTICISAPAPPHLTRGRTRLDT